MTVKSNVLTHFTRSADNLSSILANNFMPRLCKENYNYLLNKKYSIYIPMVCFCDIPLHLIHSHISDYGSYGLGLSKEWAIKNKLNPIIYLEKESRLAESIGILLENMKNMENEIILENFWKVICLLKPYQGMNKIGKNKIFYEENEWRYIPQKLHEIVDGNIIGLTLSENKATDNGIKEINQLLSKQPLVFEPEDIQYIFINKEEERKTIIEMVKEIKSSL